MSFGEIESSFLIYTLIHLKSKKMIVFQFHLRQKDYHKHIVDYLTNCRLYVQPKQCCQAKLTGAFNRLFENPGT